MELIKMSVKDFILEVDSSSPAPGGGSVSALTATLGCALSRMVGHLTFGKKKFEALDEADKQKFTEVFDKIKDVQNRLEFLIDEDTKSFGIFMDAMKLPKDTDEEKKFRTEQMEEATKQIIKVPFEIASISLEALKLVETIVEFGNKNAITDGGVAALLLDAGVVGAVLNVKINLPGLSDQTLVEDYTVKCQNFVDESEAVKSKIITYVNNNL